MNSPERKKLSIQELRPFVEPDEPEFLFSQLPRYGEWETNPRADKNEESTNFYPKGTVPSE